MIKAIVGHNGDQVKLPTKIKSFSSVEEAEDFIADVLFHQDPEGVSQGDYYIDVMGD